MMPKKPDSKRIDIDTRFDWKAIAENVLTSRAMDDIEETELRPQKKVLRQIDLRSLLEKCEA